MSKNEATTRYELIDLFRHARNNQQGGCVWSEWAAVTLDGDLVFKQPYIKGLVEVDDPERIKELIRQRGIEPVDTLGVGVSGISTTSGQALFHDDLHGANVMVDDEGRPWIVDSTTIRLSPAEQQLPTISEAIERAATLHPG